MWLSPHHCQRCILRRGLGEAGNLIPKAAWDTLWLKLINCLCGRGCWLGERNSVRSDGYVQKRRESRTWGAWKAWVRSRKGENQALSKLPDQSVNFFFFFCLCSSVLHILGWLLLVFFFFFSLLLISVQQRRYNSVCSISYYSVLLIYQCDCSQNFLLSSFHFHYKFLCTLCIW